MKAAYAAASHHLPVAIDYVSRTGSSNADLAAAGLAGAPHGSALVAGVQMFGRGRLGRSWVSLPGNLHLSVLLRPDWPLVDLPLITLAAAVALVEVVGPQAGIKWPNDLQVRQGPLRGQKLAGVLCAAETRGRRVSQVVVGVGLNVAQAPPQAACLAQLGCGRPLPQLAADIVSALLKQIEAPAGIVDAWSAHDLLRGTAVVVGAHEGVAQGIAADGALRLATTSGIVELRAGDVHVNVSG